MVSRPITGTNIRLLKPRNRVRGGDASRGRAVGVVLGLGGRAVAGGCGPVRRNAGRSDVPAARVWVRVMGLRHAWVCRRRGAA